MLELSKIIFMNFTPMVNIHIGALIKKVATEKNLSNAELGRRINTTGQNIRTIYERKSIDTDQLVSISQAMDHNFFQYYFTEKPQITSTKKLMVIVEIEEEDFIQALKQKALKSLKA